MIYCVKWDDAPNIPAFSLHRSTIAPQIRKHLEPSSTSLATIPVIGQPPRPGLYVHIPFCRSKCPYCDFYSVTSGRSAGAYIDALRKEAGLYATLFGEFGSIYLGGGTPSSLTSDQLEALVTALQEFSFSTHLEFTIEVNPDDADLGKLKKFRELGINRLSLGVQSLDDEELRFLKRRHTAAQSVKALESAKAADFQNISLDLMYGLPGQNLDRWTTTLLQSLSFEPQHISCYQLTVEKGTPLFVQKIEELDEEKGSAFFLETSDILEEKGFIHYEISNFAKAPEFFCRHNLKYWNRAAYLGLGPSAHSYKNGVRWWNHRSIEKYSKALASGERPLAGEEKLSPDQVRLERLHLGFRTSRGIGMDLIEGTPDAEKILSELQESGIITLEKHRIVPTKKGFLVADSLPLYFCR